MRSRRPMALAALAAMLFLQAAIAFANCELPDRSAVLAHAAAMATMSDCPEGTQVSLCLAHYAGEDQALMKVELALPELALPRATPIEFVPVASAPAEKGQTHLPAAGPPLRVLFQSFLL